MSQHRKDAFTNRYQANVLHGKDKAPARKWNQPDQSVPYAGRKRKGQHRKAK